MNPLFKELSERGLIYQTFGNLEECFSKPTTFYIGLDPTSDSLGVHHLVGLMVSKIMQNYGHKPIILVGGATCAIGDPSGKSEERKTISMDTVFHNVECVKKQISKIIDFDSSAPNAAIMVNNWDWYKDYKFLDFIRDVGKKITVNYLMAKENVKKRLEREGSGISFQEFSYGLLQGYDFVHLYKEYGCRSQIAGSDNLGNMITGQDLVHKMLEKDDVCGLTWELITCADGRKFGKTEGNAVFLDPLKTSPFAFYQYWLNVSDVDAESFIKKFTLYPLDKINEWIEKHRENPSLRLLQRILAEYMTEMIHGKEILDGVKQAVSSLFGGVDLNSVDDNGWNVIKNEVPSVSISKSSIEEGVSIIDIATMHDKITSKSEARKLIKAHGFSINKSKKDDEREVINSSMLIKDKYLLLQKGRKEYTLVNVS